MARREIVVYTDDVTGEESEDVQTVLLVSSGIAYEVDMSEKTREAYAAAIAPYLSAGRRIGRTTAGGSILRPTFTPGTAAPTRTVADKEQNRAVRDWWAKNQGRDGLPPLTERGRIPQDVLDAFQKHGGRTIEAAPEPVIPPAQTKRAAQTVGAEVHVSGPDFLSAETASAPEAKAAKRAPAKKATASTSEKAPRARTATASVKSNEATSGGKPQTAAKRTGRRAAAS